MKKILYALILIALYVILIATCPADAQLQHHPVADLHPESCQDAIAKQRHWLLQAAGVTQDLHQQEMMITWYVDSFRVGQVNRVCGDPKLTAVVMVRFDLAKMILAENGVIK